MSDALGIVPTREAETEERKESWNDDCLKALAALANTRGGTLWVGVDDDGHPVQPVGWAGGDKTETRISSQIVASLQAHPSSITVETVEGLPVLAICIARSPVPISVRGRYYRRVGNSTHEVPSEELPRFVLERTGARWDALPCAMEMEVLDGKTFEDFKALARKRLPALRPSDDATTILNNLQLRDDKGRLLRAAVLLFGKDQETQRLSPTAFIQVGRFKGDGSTILDDRQIAGNLFAQLDGVMTALRTYLQVEYEFPTEVGDREGAAILQRVEVWEYPLTALREAVANALLHRDYASSGRVMIRVYDDHVLVSSPGLLPEGLTVSDLSRDPHGSRLRNPLLAQAFFFTEIVERWGTGTTRMARLCIERGLPAPEFAQVGDEVWVTFRKDPYTDEMLRRMGLSSREIETIYFVRQHGEITNADYRNLTGASDRTAVRVLDALTKAGIFERRLLGPRTTYVMASNYHAIAARNPP